MRLGRWTTRLLIGGVLLVGYGCVLVIVSGYGADSGGSEALWSVGLVMTCAGLATLVVAGFVEVSARLASRRSGRKA